MAKGVMLRSHRDVEGNKTFLLHEGTEQPVQVRPHDVHKLREIGLIDSNKKFPVATFWLTDAGTDYLALHSQTK
jgi:hypothetical protein